MLIGGWAVAVHGHGRSTDDMDILVRASPTNAAKVYAALQRLGAPLGEHGVSVDLFKQPRYGYRMGRKPLLIEVLTTIDGVTFEEAAHAATTVGIGELSVPVIGRQALIANKRGSGRPKDVAALEQE